MVWAAASATLAPYAEAGTLTTLYQFTGGSDGSEPVSAIVEDVSCTLYGSAAIGGTKNCTTHVGIPTIVGCGTLYSFSRSTGLKTLVEFNGPNGAYGDNSPLLIGNTLYGSAPDGGSSDNGVLYSVRTDGSGFKLLHQFIGIDGSSPTGTLVAGPGRALYGVTALGGPGYPTKSYGVLFKISASGVYTVLHSFNKGPNGYAPNSIAVEKSGLIIGTLNEGGNTGTYCGYTGCGVLYSYSPTTAKFTVLHTFTGRPGDGAMPILGSVAKDGTVYGAAGPFFSIGPKQFTFIPASGGDDVGTGANVGPTLGSGGSLFSVAQSGPYTGSGTLYEQNDDFVSVLHNFDGTDGAGPDASPLLTPSSSLIGPTGSGGGSCSCGTIYEYVP